MEFDLILGDDKNQTTTVECCIDHTQYDIGYNITPIMVELNRYQANEKHNHWSTILNKLTMLIDEWNELQLDSNVKLPKVNIPDINLYPWLSLKQVHEDYINPLQSHCIKIYKILNDHNIVEYIEQLVTIFNTLFLFRNVSGDIISNKNHQSFSLRFSNNHTLLTDDDASNFNMTRNAGDIFLAPTAIAYDYDNLSTEKHTHNNYEYTAVKMLPKSEWYGDIGQQVSHNGDLLFWCGDSRTHEETVDDINHSLEHSWGNYKIRKTDISNKLGMLTMGMIKIGRFDVIPDAKYNKVVGYVRK